jgi:phage terminase large subunit-like protein
VVTRGTSYENILNLAPAFVERIIRRYEGTRLGRQELHAEVLDDVPGALWSLGLIDRARHREVARDRLVRVVVAIDPPAKAPASDAEKRRATDEDDGPAECGIVVAGVDAVGHGYVLEDASMRGTPLQWAAQAVTMYHEWQADRIVAEVNQGGDMVETTIHTVDARVPVKQVTATRGKLTRAEPVAALYEKETIHHVGSFPKLEDQMTQWVPGDRSPDRLDAAVWAFTELLLGPAHEPAWVR